MFDWDRAFVNTNVNEKMFILNKTIFNIFSNFIPLKTVTVDDNKKKLKNLIQEKTMFIKAIEIVKTIITCNT